MLTTEEEAKTKRCPESRAKSRNRTRALLLKFTGATKRGITAAEKRKRRASAIWLAKEFAREGWKLVSRKAS